jgi:hypothetical protein
MARRSPRLRTRHCARHVYGGHNPLSAIGTYSASTTPLANGGGSSCALNTPDYLIPELKANLGAPPAS